MDWLVSQAPCLLQRDAADLLLAHAVRRWSCVFPQEMLAVLCMNGGRC